MKLKKRKKRHAHNKQRSVRGTLLSSCGLLTSILLSRDPALLRLPRLPARNMWQDRLDIPGRHVTFHISLQHSATILGYYHRGEERVMTKGEKQVKQGDATTPQQGQAMCPHSSTEPQLALVGPPNRGEATLFLLCQRFSTSPAWRCETKKKKIIKKRKSMLKRSPYLENSSSPLLGKHH